MLRKQRTHVRQHVRSKQCRSRELPKAVPLLLRLATVELPLERNATDFDRCQCFHLLQSKLGEFIDPVFPHPIDPLRRFVSEIAGIEISAQEQHETYFRAIGDTQLAHLRRLLLAPLIHVREVARRFRFYQKRHVASLRALWHDDNVDGYIGRCRKTFAFHGYVQAETERAWWHSIEFGLGRKRLITVGQ